MNDAPLPLGKLPPDLLAALLAQATTADPDVLLGPGVGLDCAVVRTGDTLLVFKSDPITFATDEIGWYLVQINANDIATTGATPRWLLATLLLPEGQTTAVSVTIIMTQITDVCRELNIALIGGHTEITYGLDRPIVVGTLVGAVTPERLVTPRGATPGDRILLTKGVPIEAVAILAREFPERLADDLSASELAQARDFLTNPGISVLRDAQIAARAGKVTAMHDPTEGGLAGALWELAEASGRSLVVNPALIPIPPLAARICRVFGLNPLATIASGALLLTASPEAAKSIRQALLAAGIACAEIGWVEEGSAAVWREGGNGRILLPRPARDEIARVYES
ncbi:MAG: AIR synthase [Chloroflexi bacterium]|nr:AIR synthase [Chloroflexota bacterium]